MSSSRERSLQPSCVGEWDDECEWFPFMLTDRVQSTGERREQVWWGRDANHALERACCIPGGLMWPVPDSVKAERTYPND